MSFWINLRITIQLQAQVQLRRKNSACRLFCLFNKFDVLPAALSSIWAAESMKDTELRVEVLQMRAQITTHRKTSSRIALQIKSPSFDIAHWGWGCLCSSLTLRKSAEETSEKKAASGLDQRALTTLDYHQLLR